MHNGQSGFARTWTNEDVVPLFFYLLVALFLGTAFAPWIMGQWRTHNETSSAVQDSPLKNREIFIQAFQKHVTLAHEKGARYSFDDQARAGFELRSLSDKASPEEFTKITDQTIKRLYAQAVSNFVVQTGKVTPGEIEVAHMEARERSYLSREREDFLRGLEGFLGAVGKQYIWFSLLVAPAVFLLRIGYIQGWRAHNFAVELGPRLWWFCLAVLLWPFLAQRYSVVQPRATLRFWWLRMRYLLRYRKLFLTVAEKDALFAQAGSAEDDVEAVLSYVEAIAASATGNARRYVFAAALGAMVPVDLTGTAAAVFAQPLTTIPLTVQTKQEYLDLSVHGFLVATAFIESPHKAPELTMFRIKPRVVKDSISLNLEFDPTLQDHLVSAALEHRVTSSLSLEAGRIYGPFVSFYPLPTRVLSVHSPFRGVGLPFVDTGASVKYTQGMMMYRLYALRGSGVHKDDNNALDYAGQIGITFPHASFRFINQQGRQPDGMRAFYGIEGSFTADILSLRSGFMRRPDRHATSFFTEMGLRVGSIEYVGMTERLEKGDERTQYFDAGVHWNITSSFRVMGHMIVGANKEPTYALRTTYAF